MADTIYQGQRLVFTAAFKDANGTAYDPAIVRFKIVDPAGTVTTLVYGTDAAVTKPSTGNYRVEKTVTTKGKHSAGWFGVAAGGADSDGLAVGVDEFQVEDLPFD